MRVLLLGDARVLLSHITGKGHKITLDPGDSPDVAVSDIMTCEFAPEEVPLIVLGTGTVADWTARQKRPDAKFAKSAEEALKVIEENAPEQEYQPESEKPFLISYANKGGVGKTTTAVSIAVVLASSGLKVVICDFNIAAPDIATFFNLKPSCGIEKAAEDIDSVLLKAADNLWVLPGPSKVIAKQFTGDELLEIVKILQKRFDVVVADTPPEPWTKEYMHKVFSHADLVYAVVDQSSFSIQETGVFAPTLLAMGVKPSNIRIVVNKYNPKLVGLKEIEKAFCAGFKKGTTPLPKVAAVIPENWEQHIKAGYQGTILHEDEWLKLVKEVVEMTGVEYETSSVVNSWKRGLLAWLTT
jgi:MinD-like ATPase involved in chromosome partitioning or flagellar assembly